MAWLLDIGLSNAALAAALAVFVALLGCVCRRPALLHGLWLLVLLKLITPPLLWLPLTTPEQDLVASAETVPAAEAPVAAATTEAPAPEAVPVLPEAAPEAGAAAPEVAAAGEAEELGGTAEVTSVPGIDLEAWLAAWWRPVVGGAWVVGSLCWFVVAGVRLARFGRLVCLAQRAPAELQAEAAALAPRLGLARAPGVWLVPGTVSPMLWAMGGAPRLLLPARLLDGLDAGQRAALILHELAHLRRRDHWVRYLELVVLGLYWWHPAAWWARHELREAEEQCCDAWVVWALPDLARDYARALLATVAFFSESRPMLPATASGMGHVHHLRRRITMIMNGTPPRGLGRAGSLAVLGLGLLLLPIVPAWAQRPERKDDDDKRPKNREEQIEKVIKKVQEEIREVQDRARRERGEGDKDREREGDKGRERDRREAQERDRREAEERERHREGDRQRHEVERLADELRATQRRLEQTMAELEKAHRRLAEMEQRPGGGPPDRGRGDGPPFSRGPGFGRGEGGPRPGGLLSRGREEGPRPGAAPREGGPRPGGPDDARLRDVERKLDQVLQELENLRREQRGPRDPVGGMHRQGGREERPAPRPEGAEGGRPRPPQPPRGPEAGEGRPRPPQPPRGPEAGEGRPRPPQPPRGPEGGEGRPQPPRGPEGGEGRPRPPQPPQQPPQPPQPPRPVQF